MDLWDKLLTRLRRDKRSDYALARLARMPRSTMRDIRNRRVAYPSLANMRRIARIYAV